MPAHILFSFLTEREISKDVRSCANSALSRTLVTPSLQLGQTRNEGNTLCDTLHLNLLWVES